MLEGARNELDNQCTMIQLWLGLLSGRTRAKKASHEPVIGVILVIEMKRVNMRVLHYKRHCQSALFEGCCCANSSIRLYGFHVMKCG